MRLRSSTIVALAVLGCFAALPAVSPAQAPTTAPSAGTATGTWTWTQPGRNSDTEMSLKIQQTGDKVTGMLIGQGGRESEITDGTFKAGQLVFKVVRDMNGQTSVTTYTATISGDTLNAKSETVQTRTFTAARAK
ncbi:MAG TPA: hypothetical protein VF595_12475 [Tepidisphaeraceae bacterium]|jgi:hypothetical protein